MADDNICPACGKNLDAIMAHVHYIGDVGSEYYAVAYYGADSSKNLSRETIVWHSSFPHSKISFLELISLERLEKLLLLS